MKKMTPAIEYKKDKPTLTNTIKLHLAVIFILLFIAMPHLPDYKTYQLIYEERGGYLAIFGRDPGFVLLINTFEPFISYNLFRQFTLALLAFITLLSIQNLQKSLPSKISNVFVLAITPYILLKYGIQIREGIALCLWLAIIMSADNRPKILPFIAIALISISFHISSTPLWALLAIAFYFQPHFPRTASIISISIFASYIFFVADVSRLEQDAFSGLNQKAITISIIQILYWCIYICIFLAAALSNNIKTHKHTPMPNGIRSMQFITKSAMIGFAIGVFIQGINYGSELLQKGLISDLMRIAALLLFIYSTLLAAQRKNIMSLFISTFLMIDTLRIILSA
ncbi:hypothetical protein [Craterilacuibacter sinensis]|uniref:EpsG family protein n=1 Tax=Craterilacuibacter sinensis TaxID=2686017 RepID=A0A845BLX4_9NEIS|nr:hypothetical protein [Craterilacuibacter sinensis]MXR37657.1 hypothetical protein [Craterilacuibacter sinensis]